ncbi:MAG: hypothetical protein ACRC62_17690 [Microcoleus sp.]
MNETQKIPLGTQQQIPKNVWKWNKNIIGSCCEDTHYRVGDWEVVSIEQYPTESPGSKYDLIAVCYCKWAPKPSPLMPVPNTQISIDSFGGDKAAYQQYLENQTKSEIYSP